MPTDTIDNTKRWLAPKFENFPAYLTARPNWALWRYEWDEAKSEWGKTPYQAHNPTRRASSTNPRTWARLDVAKAAYGRGGYDGVLFAMSPEAGLTVIDVDHCITGNVISKHAKEVLDTVPDTYWEISPSIEGLRGFAIGTKKATRCKNADLNTEVYCNIRFVSVTGHRVNQADITHCQTELDALCDWLLPEPQDKTPAHKCQPVDIDDEALLAKARRSKEGERFAALYDHDTDKLKTLGYPTKIATGELDGSSIDQALANRLAFWCGNEAERIERLMRNSALYRYKWDSHRTYLQDTISNAIACTKEVYTPDPTSLTASDTERIAKMADDYTLSPHNAADGLLDGPTEEIDIAAHLPEQYLPKIDIRPEISKALTMGGQTNTPTVTGACEAGQDCYVDIFADDFLAGEERHWIIEDFIARGDIMMLAAPSKAGKALLLQWAIQSILYNEQFLGGDCCPPLPILYHDYEMRRGYFREWYEKLLGDRERATTSKYLHYRCRNGIDGVRGALPPFMYPAWLAEHTKPYEDRFGQPGLLVIDTLRGAFALADNEPNWENSASGVGKIVRPISDFCHASKWACIVIHHLNKTGGVSGSTDCSAAVDHVCRFHRDIEAKSNVCHISLDGRFNKIIPARVATFEETGFTYQGTEAEWAEASRKQDSKKHLADCIGKVLGFMQEGQEYSTTHLETYMSGQKWGRETQRLIKKGLEPLVNTEDKVNTTGRYKAWKRTESTDSLHALYLAN